MKNTKKLMGTVLTVILSMILLAGLTPTSVFANWDDVQNDSVSYVERSWDGSQVVSETKSSGPYQLLVDRTESNAPQGGVNRFALFDGRVFSDHRNVWWFYADRNQTFDERCIVQGDVHLVIADGVTITCKDGIWVPAGSTLNIYAQEGGTGTLYCEADTNDNAAIGANNENGDCGTVVIHGGNITADSNTRGTDAAGIGGGDEGNGGKVIIYGGDVTAKGGTRGAGIGGGDRDNDKGGNGGETYIYGGTVYAKGGEYGAGIGGGELGNGGRIEIRGATTYVSATGGYRAAGIGGGDGGNSGYIYILEAGEVKAFGTDDALSTGNAGAGIGGGNEGGADYIEIYKSKVSARSDTDGAGIGGGDCGGVGTISIIGGEVTAIGGSCGAGIGGGESGNIGTIIIGDDNGTETKVTATGGKGGAGIGGGDTAGYDSISIHGSGTEVTATGGDQAAGIGGGNEGPKYNNGKIIISGGTVNATGGTDFGAGIGGGDEMEGGNITITGGDITASGGNSASGIGGGDQGCGGNITIEGGKVKATGGNVRGQNSGGAGIGSGHSAHSSNGCSMTITINGGEIDATGGPEGAGIGSGCSGYVGTIAINNGTVKAQGGIRGGAGIGTGREGELDENSSVSINGGEVTATGGEAANWGGFKHYTGAAVGCGGLKDHINSERASAYFKGSINLNGGTIHASYSGENLFGAAVIGAVDERPSATINIKAKCKIYVKKGGNSSGKAMMPMKAKTVNLQNVTEGSTVYSSKVYNIDNTSDIAPAANRVAWCTATNDNKSIAIVPCEHDGDATYTDLGEVGHRVSCHNCTAPAEEITNPHSWSEAVYTWAADNSSVTGECSCKLCGHEESETVAAKYVVTYEPTCVSKGKAKYESGFFRKSCFEIQSKPAKDIDPDPNNHLWFIDKMTEDPSYCDGYKIESHCIWCHATKTSDKHDWGETTYTWAEDNSKVTAKHVCNKCNHIEEENVDTVYTVTEEASCVAEGEASYTASFTKAGFEKQIKTGITVPINPNNHDWDEPTYKWTDDNSSVTAKRVCANNASHVETETASTASEVTKPATCEGKGETTYTAEFENEAFEIQTKTVDNIDPTSHDWGEPSYEWADDNSTVTASRTCTHNSDHVETEDAATTSEVTTPATCEGKGAATYTSGEFTNTAFEVQTKTVDINPIGHDWTEPTYEWNSDFTKVTATHICNNDATHVETETVDATSEVTKEPTEDEDGEITYTSAEFTNQTFEQQEKIETIPATGHTHDWGEPTYTWADDKSTVTATRTCSKNADHTDTETVNTVSQVTKKPTCTEKGEKTYTAEFENTAFTKQTQTEEVAPNGHTPGEAVKERVIDATCETSGSYEDVVYCIVCKEELSREEKVIDVQGHDWGEWLVTREPTEEAEGVETRTCARCGETETRPVDKLEPKPKPDPADKIYSNTKGDGNVWTKGSGITSDFTFVRSTDDAETFEHFTGILVDGKAVEETAYTVESGSVIIKLKAEYLETLTIGRHVLTALFDDGDGATADFTIIKEDEPDPVGGNYYPVTWDPSGGTFSKENYPYEETDKKILQPAYMGTEIEVLAAPVREGYTFLYWETDGKQYKPREKFTVEEQGIVFTARWQKKNTTPTNQGSGSGYSGTAARTASSTSTTTAPKTGDESNAMLWFLLMSVSMGALLLIGSRRKLMK